VSLSHTEVNQSHSAPVQVFPKTKGSFFPENNPTTSSNQASDTNIVAKSQPIKTTVSFVKSDNTPVQASQSEISAAQSKKKSSSASQEVGAKEKSKPKIRAGCIAARASFWEKKIQGDPNDVSVEEFPEMVEHVKE